MATGTMKPPKSGAATATPATQRTAEEYVADSIGKMRTEEELYLRRARGDPAPSDMVFFTSLGRTDQQIKDGITRAERNFGWMGQAGTAAQRAGWKKTFEEHNDRVRTDVVRLRAEAAAKLGEADTIIRERDAAHRVVEVSDRAVELLMDYNYAEPSVQRELIAIKRENHAHPAVRETTELRARLKFLGEAVKWTVHDNGPQIRLYFTGAKGNTPDAALGNEFLGASEFERGWAVEREQLLQEQTDKAARLAEVEPIAEACWARYEAKRRHYLDLIELETAAA
jgi:hypothetical protein